MAGIAKDRPRLNRSLVLERAVRLADDAGGFTVQWTAQGRHWAEVTAGTGREAAGIGTALSRVAYRIRLRAAPFGAPSRPVAGDRLRDGTRIFAVLAVAECDAGARYLDCTCQEETAA